MGAIGCVGHDPFGRFLIDRLAADGVETSGVRQRDDVGTSGTLIINVAGEDRRFIHATGANAVLQAGDLPLDRVAQGQSVLRRRILADAGPRSARCAGRAVSAGAGGGSRHGARRGASGPRRPLAETGCGAGRNRRLPAQRRRGGDPRRSGASARSSAAVSRRRGGMRGHHARRTRNIVGRTTTSRSRRRPTRRSSSAAPAPEMPSPPDSSPDCWPVRIRSGCLKWGAALGASCVRSIAASDTVFTRDEALAFMRQHELKIEPVR